MTMTLTVVILRLGTKEFQQTSVAFPQRTDFWQTFTLGDRSYHYRPANQNCYLTKPQPKFNPDGVDEFNRAVDLATVVSLPPWLLCWRHPNRMRRQSHRVDIG